MTLTLYKHEIGYLGKFGYLGHCDCEISRWLVDSSIQDAPAEVSLAAAQAGLRGAAATGAAAEAAAGRGGQPPAGGGQLPAAAGAGQGEEGGDGEEVQGDLQTASQQDQQLSR